MVPQYGGGHGGRKWKSCIDPLGVPFVVCPGQQPQEFIPPVFGNKKKNNSWDHGLDSKSLCSLASRLFYSLEEVKRCRMRTKQKGNL